jgi:hypothetical protein
MKGLELPVNTLVVISIAVLVMLGLVAMFMAGTGPFTIVVEMSAKGSACNVLTSANCEIPVGSVPIEFGDYKTLYEYCESKYISHYVVMYGKDIYDAETDTFYGESADVKQYCKSFICGCPGVNFDGPSNV